MLQTFKQQMANLLELEVNELVSDLQLNELMTWDSLTVVSTIALMDEHFNVAAADKISDCHTFSDILKLAKVNPEQLN